jgi:CRISPR-associated Cas5-like protein
LIVQVRAPVASFRRPLDHNYQRTLPMPPPTTLKGIAGAALGLSDRELWAPDSPLRGLKVSVWMEDEPGRARDLWTVLKIKNARIEARSPYFRELLFFTRYTLLYGGDEALLQKLAQAFYDPVYPLSLGREDELLLVEAVQRVEAQPGEPRFQGTLVPGDVRQRADLRPILQEGAVFTPPIVETLPLGFTIDAKGIRHPEAPMPVSFLPLGGELELPGLPAWMWAGRAWVWVERPVQAA